MEKPLVLIVDDDATNNKVCEIIVKKALGDVPVKSFTSPDLAFEFIINQLQNTHKGNVLLIIDIAMPVITGWDFLACLQSLDEKFVSRFTNVLLTGSTNKADSLHASLHTLVHGFLVKPLTVSKLREVLPGMARKRKVLSSLAFL